MNMIRRNVIRTVIFALCSVVALSSCTDDLEIGGYHPQGDCLFFVASMDNKAISANTRSSARHIAMEQEDWLVADENGDETRASITMHMEGDVGISAFAGTANASVSELQNAKYTFDGDILTTTSPTRWSTLQSNESLLFSAYSPYYDGNTTTGQHFSVPESGDENHGKPVLYYTVPSDVAEQIDIIADTTVVPKTKFGQVTAFSFEHLLTAVRFKVGFKCRVYKLEVKGVCGDGVFSLLDNTIVSKTGAVPTNFSLEYDGGAELSQESYITSDEQIFMMIPQDFPVSSAATVELIYDKGEGKKTLVASLAGKKWGAGKLVTYTLYDKDINYIYMDLAAGNVDINNLTYSGKRWTLDGSGNIILEDVTGQHKNANVYYVYQSTSGDSKYGIADNRKLCGFRDNEFTPPLYELVQGPDGQSWSEYITNNRNVKDVIEMWDDGVNVRGASAENEQHIGVAKVRDAGRTHTENHIKVTGRDSMFMLLVDNIYTTSQQNSVGRSQGGITYIPSGNTSLNIDLVGDNRVAYVHINNTATDVITIEGSGSLTAADADFLTKVSSKVDDTYGDTNHDYGSNYWNSAIGNNDTGSGNLYNLNINSGVIFAGTTKVENCTAIGAGGNGYGEVFINGGSVTAVATTTGTAIGGGIGFNSAGGRGLVKITGGNVYAYNFANRWGIPSSAIGGAGTKFSDATHGEIEIMGGNVYAESDLGTAIGGGSSYAKQGGTAKITISGGKVVAKSNTLSAGIGGGCSYTEGFTETSNTSNLNGGNAEIIITGNPIVRTGSIGGGTTGANNGKIGSAQITIDGGDIQAQFVMMDADSKNPPKFEMKSGTIRNSDTSDSEYRHIRDYGGAVFMENGSFVMSGGTIKNCSAIKGGAVYITDPNPSDSNVPKFEMSGDAKIEHCVASTDGGGVYLVGGDVLLKGNACVSYNLAQKGNGGGIFLNHGTFKMTGEATLQYNSAMYDETEHRGGEGGGLYISSLISNLDVSLHDGYIQRNSCDRYGGGICVDMSETSMSADVYVGGNIDGVNGDPQITGNFAMVEGGGLYTSGTNTHIIFNDGMIQNNTVSGYVENPNVANVGGLVTLNGGDVTHIVVTFDGNKGYTTDGTLSETAIQKIVTNTRSLLVTPEFARAGWEFVEWTDRADGTGEVYRNGQEINRKTNLTLYARWRLVQ